ncbi:DUF4174 domain-containing protein [Roseovarius indicus]|uniref:DUF4174 domain-containing protein n=2 Tax=Roseovarius indicus TaxID=540747 RepID=A0A5P3AG78_9RHOB|nr:DUF4174 domain-containing protein [Roseovarius indicus]QEW27590.1 hypothetical protein RIdsm_03406 [Roseovarius indicus]SFE35188.1 protein of unknown function [Roseovarius indicus]
MPKTLTLVFLSFLAALGVAGPAMSQDDLSRDELILPGSSVKLEDFMWIKRPLVVFADSPADPRYVQQMEYITERLDDLDRRDVVVLTDTDKGADTALRKELRPRGFMLVLIGKDGTIYLRKPLPWSVREISRVIDKLPMRQQEVRDRRGES